MVDTRKIVDGDGLPVVFIEFHHEKSGWKPFSVICQDGKTRHEYDFDWCEKSAVLCYHNSGCGPARQELGLFQFCNPELLPGRIWCDKSIKLVDEHGNELDVDSLKVMGYKRLIRRPDNPFDVANDDSAEYCEVCDSRYPNENLCEHVVWSDEQGGYAGCGHSETDIGETHNSIFRLLQVLPDSFVSGAIEAMRKGRFSFGRQYGDYTCRVPELCTIDEGHLFAEYEGERRYGPAFDWLRTLDKESVLPNALTLGWFWQFQREKWTNRGVIGNITFIRELADSELDKWLALDPHSNKLPPFYVPKKFKVTCANDAQFIENPKGTTEVILWTKGKNKHERSLKLSVAAVNVCKSRIEIVFGRILERGYKHISEMDGYKICSKG